MSLSNEEQASFKRSTIRKWQFFGMLPSFGSLLAKVVEWKEAGAKAGWRSEVDGRS